MTWLRSCYPRLRSDHPLRGGGDLIRVFGSGSKLGSRLGSRIKVIRVLPYQPPWPGITPDYPPNILAKEWRVLPPAAGRQSCRNPINLVGNSSAALGRLGRSGSRPCPRMHRATPLAEPTQHGQAWQANLCPLATSGTEPTQRGQAHPVQRNPAGWEACQVLHSVNLCPLAVSYLSRAAENASALYRPLAPICVVPSVDTHITTH